MSLYTVEIVNPQGSLVADVSSIATSRRFTVRRNRAETIELGFDLGEAAKIAATLGTPLLQLFAPGSSEVRLRRGDRYLVGGQIAYARPSLTADNRALEVRATGFLDLFKDRYLFPPDTLSYTADMGQIVAAMMNQNQAKPNGSFGCTVGTIQASRTITDTWQPFASSLKDIWIGLTDRINGIDLEFTYDKKLNVYYPGIGTEKTELLFSYPGTIREIALPVDATQLTNVSINRGAGNGLDQQPVQTRQSLPSQASYARRERIDDYPSISVVQTLNDKGDESLRLGSSPTTVPDVTLDGATEPRLGFYWIGDRVRFAVSDPAFAVLDGQTWRINEIDVTVDENDHETIRLKVGY
ncbi:MAG: siphovirus ReqiPepy6 Gp37-like family protein [Chloroflexota bacterium]|nr:siphovirus ReqiPepy6 Gp37-like family protein [Chloroflexota bacterium]